MRPRGRLLRRKGKKRQACSTNSERCSISSPRLIPRSKQSTISRKCAGERKGGFRQPYSSGEAILDGQRPRGLPDVLKRCAGLQARRRQTLPGQGLQGG